MSLPLPEHKCAAHLYLWTQAIRNGISGTSNGSTRNVIVVASSEEEARRIVHRYVLTQIGTELTTHFLLAPEVAPPGLFYRLDKSIGILVGGEDDGPR